ncbi:MAG: hypothetical protein JWN76_984 [Chitinophagaceae bacterium]|nr:hypothetical protein [Chitinophagaceae bacterium]
MPRFINTLTLGVISNNQSIGVKYLFFLCVHIVLIWNTVIAQRYEKIVVNAKDTTSGYYLAVKPPTSTISGVLVLLDGFGGAPESIPIESMLPNIAYANGILTVAATMGQKVYADSAVIGKLNLLLRDVIKRYNVSPDKFVIGGFSAGGTISLRYVELCKESPSKYPVYPRAVFTVDSPVDLIDLWGLFEKQIEKNYSDVAVGEAKFVSAVMEREHGTPTSNLQTYKWLTPFNHLEKGDGNEKYLKEIPVRVYHDVDIVWRLQNRRQSGYEANYLNSSEMILRLLLLKNNDAEFVKGRTGYRSNGMRHPHSWNIVDEIEFIQWMKKIMVK